MHLIVEMRFGSHLYGTATEQSDLDTKSVFIPAAKDILLQRVRHAIVAPGAKSADRKNAPGAVESEAYSLQRYLELLAEGQTVALDMLFAPDSAMLREPDPLWRELQANTGRLVTRRASFFVRYCRQQANKYGIKGLTRRGGAPGAGVAVRRRGQGMAPPPSWRSSNPSLPRWRRLRTIPAWSMCRRQGIG